LKSPSSRGLSAIAELLVLVLAFSKDEVRDFTCRVGVRVRA